MRNKFRRFFILFLILLFFFVACPVTASSSSEVKKDPFLAAALSWFIPGLGQIYVGKPVKGLCFWAIDNALFWGAILTIADVHIGLEGDIGFSFSIRFKRSPSRTRVWTAVGLGIAYLGFHIYNVIDASDEADEHNQRILMRELQREGLSLDMRYDSTGLKYSLRF